jgi:phosphoenolpyruvate carboxykinase (ATP)
MHWNLSPAALYEEALRRGEAELVDGGAINALTGSRTGRSPNDKFVVRTAVNDDRVWWGPINQSMTPEDFAALEQGFARYLEGRDLFVQDLLAGADPRYQVRVRVVTQLAWHSLFAQNLLIRPGATDAVGPDTRPDVTIVDAAHFAADPSTQGVRSATAIAMDLERSRILIGGTEYAGEIKKSVFTLLNYALPLRGVLPMHCSANRGPAGDVALFFGLSGTGKTTLSADARRGLIGDDEHGWSDDGIFNFEGGCYAKAIRLSATAEPEIFAATRRFGTVLENVRVDPGTRAARFDDDRYTENTRAAYPIEYIPNAVVPGVAGHPRTILFLAADAFGVLPPIARLTPEQAMYHFLSGYTAEVAGTVVGLGAEPRATFSACFGSPFLPLPPTVYAELLGEKIARHDVRCYLVNTGWSGGPYGVGARMPIALTRALVSAALDGSLDDAPSTTEPFFGLSIPIGGPGEASNRLDPRATWADPLAYDAQAQRLAAMFEANFRQFGDVPPRIRQAGPRPPRN